MLGPRLGKLRRGQSRGMACGENRGARIRLQTAIRHELVNWTRRARSSLRVRSTRHSAQKSQKFDILLNRTAGARKQLLNFDAVVSASGGVLVSKIGPMKNRGYRPAEMNPS